MVFLSKILAVRWVKHHTNQVLGKPLVSHDPYWRKVRSLKDKVTKHS